MEFMYTEGESLKTISSQERTNQSSLNIEDLKMRWDRNKTTLATSRHINLSLPLLPSGPGGVHNNLLREDQGGVLIITYPRDYLRQTIQYYSETILIG